jgi:hypothetical protein
MNNTRISYAARPDATPESELSVLANVYSYLIQTHDSKRATESAQPCAGDTTSGTRRKEAEMT